MTFVLGNRSRERLQGVHPELVKCVETAITLTLIDFTILEGVRTIERQKKLFASGASTTMNSRHLTGHAVDLGAYVDGEVRWDWPLYYKIADAMKEAARMTGLNSDVGHGLNGLEWGGDWQSFKDGPHYQLNWDSFPKE